MNFLAAAVPISFFSNLSDQLYQGLVEDNRYLYIITGLGNTLLITFFAVILGVVIGTSLRLSGWQMQTILQSFASQTESARCI